MGRGIDGFFFVEIFRFKTNIKNEVREFMYLIGSYKVYFEFRYGFYRGIVLLCTCLVIWFFGFREGTWGLLKIGIWRILRNSS